jgi:hypothetical protein
MAALLIGQAAAVLTLTAAVIYTAGDLVLGLKLWDSQVPWETVLSSMPRNLILINAANSLIPACAVAVPIYYIYNRVYESGFRRGVVLVPLIAAAVTSLAMIYLLPRNAHSVKMGSVSDKVRPSLQLVGTSLEISAVVMLLAFVGVWLVCEHITNAPVRHFLGAGMVALAFTPCVASINASYPLPEVTLCGSGFSANDGGGRHYMNADLISSDGQSVYVTDLVGFVPGNPNNIVAVIPASSIKAQSIGFINSNCDYLAPDSASRSPVK